MDFKLVKNKVEKAYRWCRARWAEFRTWQLTPVAYPELDPEEALGLFLTAGSFSMVCFVRVAVRTRALSA